MDTKLPSVFTLRWNAKLGVYVLTSSAGFRTTFGNLVPYGVILAESQRMAKEAKAELIVCELCD